MNKNADTPVHDATDLWDLWFSCDVVMCSCLDSLLYLISRYKECAHFQGRKQIYCPHELASN